MTLTNLTFKTDGAGLYQITRELSAYVRHSHPTGAGLLTLFIQHTSASLLIQENADPEVQTDLQKFFQRLVPPSDDPSMSYLTHTYEGPDDMPAHIKASILPTHLSIPMIDGALALGQWQGIYLFEHRTLPQTRHLVLHLT